jgi:hypothetical protein
MGRAPKRKQSPAQKETVERVMHEFKEGELEGRDGRPVTNPKQAIAIALSEAGASNRVSPEANRRNLGRTKKQEGAMEKTRAELYSEAKKRDVPGRSRMSKAELARAVAR